MSSYLSTLAGQLPQYADDLNQMKDLHHKKLWHQLTDLVESFLHKEGVLATVPLVEFYDRVIADFASRANQLRLAALAVLISGQLAGLEDKMAFLTKVLSAKYIADHKEATIILSSANAIVELEAGKVEEASARIEKVENLLERLPSADAGVHAACYKAKAELARSKSDVSAFYRAGLQYLAYEQLEDVVPEAARVSLAVDMSIASLKAQEVFNFGELLEKGVATVLSGTQHEWVAQVLTALNNGQLKEWHSLEQQYAAELNTHLKGFDALIKQKASILALIELLFHRDADNRVVSFKDIAEATATPLLSVELLVMKALSLKLIKGRIDQTTLSVNVSWVQPRVLGQDQIILMKDRLFAWKETVSGALDLMESQISPEILS